MYFQRALVAQISDFIHKRLIWLVAASYLLAGLLPAPGLWLRGVHVGTVRLFQEQTEVFLPMVLLAWLLFNAGLGVQAAQLRHLGRRPTVLLGGLLANVVVPMLFICCVAQATRFWHNTDEVQHILIGLALVAAMPIAGSSTAWSQNANGDIALSLGLVLLSTILSPLTTPATFDVVMRVVADEYAPLLGTLKNSGARSFLFLCVLAPSLLGILAQRVLSPPRLRAIKPGLKLINLVNLLVLNYANAAVSLPKMIASPDWDFLLLSLGIVLCLCVLTFATGWGLGGVLRAGPAQRASLMFGLGMTNNGTGLVLASLTLGAYPRMMLPILLYNLIQHLVAAFVDARLCRSPSLALA
jgi:BASS family bile acid:Na+ symporter